MDTIKSLHWPLILGLGALALIRPLTRIAEDQLDFFDGSAVVPIALTVMISAIWIAVVGLSKTVQPVLTLLFAGLAYAVFSIILSGILSPILIGELQGPLANPIAIAPMLLTNAIWGLAAGGLALLVQRLRGIRAPQPRTNDYPTSKGRS
ncbi:MAG: hypothetical protein Q4G34_02980 [Micrococcus sp.]|nr:hypothetical protein [Micrococcus sp.]